tara:strand:- start:812 stop:1678 length:867 start_codon:yes stop_codon:yes gene_type:complete
MQKIMKDWRKYHHANLLLEIEAVQAEAVAEVDSATQEAVKAEEQYDAIFDDPQKMLEAYMKLCEQYQGTDRRLWYDKNGDMKEDVKERFQQFMEPLTALSTKLSKAQGSNVPIEDLLRGWGSASAFGGGGVALAGAIDIWRSTVAPGIEWVGFGNGSWTGFEAVGSLGTTEFLVPAVVLAGVSFTLYLLSKMIKLSKQKWRALTDHMAFAKSAAEFAIDAGKTIFKSAFAALKWTKEAIQIAWSKVRGMFGSDKEAPEELPPHDPADIVKKLHEILNCKPFYTSVSIL